MPTVCKHNERAAYCWQCKDEAIAEALRELAQARAELVSQLAAWKTQQFHLEAEERESEYWQARAEKAEAECDAAVKDAERYRHLKGGAIAQYAKPFGDEIDQRMFYTFPRFIALTCVGTEVTLDDAIDTAIAARKP